MPRAVECLLVGTGGHASEDAIEQLRSLVETRFGAVPVVLAEQQATPSNVLAALEAIAARNQRRGFLFVSMFSGHGGIDDGVHAWRLAGGSLSDEQLTAKIGAFHPDSEVFMISDCCYGTGMLHIREPLDDDADPLRPARPPEPSEALIELQRAAVERLLRSFTSRAAMELRESGLIDKGRMPIGHVVLAAASDWLLVRNHARHNDFVRALCQAIPLSPTYGSLLATMTQRIAPRGQCNWIIDAEPDSALDRPTLSCEG